MLGRLRMSIEDCITAYSKLSKEVFVKKRMLLNFKGDVQARFDTAALEKAVLKYIEAAGLPKDALMWDTDDIQCKT